MPSSNPAFGIGVELPVALAVIGETQAIINNNTRIGILNMQAGEDEKINLPSTNYTVATIQQKVFSRSNIGMILINKQAFQDSIGGEFTRHPNEFSRA